MDELNRPNRLVFESGEIPRKFEFNIGGNTGASYEVELKNQTIEYTWYSSGRERSGTERVTPDMDQWRSFREKLDDLGFWSWNRRCSDSRVVDGTSWSVLICWGHQRVESEQGARRPARFEGLLSAVSGLIGGRAFR